MIQKARDGWAFLLTKLNMLGSLLLAYALANPSAVTELIALLPPSLRVWAPAAAIAWFVLVQVAKASAIKKAMPTEKADGQ